MIPRECKRLAEVDFPIADVSKHSAREKSIRFGHPSTLHLWWARRPLAACRAMLMALLLPDPCDNACPVEFKSAARAALVKTWQKPAGKDEDLRAALLKFIADFANWDNSSNPVYLETARALVQAAHPDEPPTVVDPFAGGGSIPLEALRLGCDVYASDLNPVACLILKVMLEDIPRHGNKIARELRKAGADIKAAAERELATFYPADKNGVTPVAYLWARTVRCETPNCGAEIPLMRSLWLSKKANRRRAMCYRVVRPNGERPQLEFDIFEPKNDNEVQQGTVSRAKATCRCCNKTLLAKRVQAQLVAQRGGADVRFDAEGHRTGGAFLLAVAILKDEVDGREYRLAAESDYHAVWSAHLRLKNVIRGRFVDGSSPLPDEPLPFMSGTFNVPLYGMTTWGDLFTERQKLALLSCSAEALSVAKAKPELARLAPLAVSRFADISNALCQWESGKTQVRHLFTRQAIPMLWDFAEPALFGDQAGDLSVTIETMARVCDRFAVIEKTGDVSQRDARAAGLPEATASVWCTDPPYYFAVPYADLSDFFFCWLKRTTPAGILPSSVPLSPEGLTPKEDELCEMAHWDATRYEEKDQAFFEKGVHVSFAQGRKVLGDEGIGCVVFAHKTTEGWEALLTGMIKGGWVITASWPIVTEAANRLRARNSAALATSVHLVCRPRTDHISGDWGEVLLELPKRVRDWMARLQKEGVRGADLVFACIGPALEIFSRYASVETPDGTEKKLPEYLERVWEVVGHVALEQVLGTPEAQARNGGAGALEEDARLTALFLWTVQSANDELADSEESEDDEASDEEETEPPRKKPGLTLIYDVTRRFAQPLGIHLAEWEGRIIETKKGVVRLLPVRERSALLFGDVGADLAAQRIERLSRGAEQLDLFSAAGVADSISPDEPPKRGKKKAVADEALNTRREATTLDRVHAAMLLQAGGRANALRSLLKSEIERSPDFLRLANALSALYPKDSEEKRLLDAMLLAVRR
jgi:adenine-specific DNA methylase